MDIQIAKLRAVLGLLKPAVPRKTALPVLTSVLFKNGNAVATDLETMVIIPVPEADEPCLLPYTDIVKMLQYTQGGDYLHIVPEPGKVTLTWSEGKSTFSSKELADYPEIPEFISVVEASLDADTLIPAMVSLLPYLATETDRPVLNGVTLSLGEPIEIAGGDGFRMAYQVLPLAFPQNITTIIPSSSVNTLSVLWEKTPRTPPPSDSLIPVIMAKKQVAVAFDGKQGLRFVFGQAATAIVKLVDGSPPVWMKLIPKEEPALQTQVMAGELELAVRRAMRVASSGNNIIRMVFNDSTATISAKGEQQEVESSIKTFGTKGAPNKVGLSANFLLDYLKGKEGVVTIAMTGGTAPVMLQHQKNPRVLIMPMQVDW